MEYTMNMNDAAYEMARMDELDDNYAALLDYLNSPNFRSFGDGLKAIILSKMPAESTMTPQEFLQSCCKDKEITVASAATLYNWFQKGIRPDRAEQRREAMFALAFALELTADETTDLFHKIYLDRAFNKRSYKELIYYHCMKRGSTYSHAQKLISLVSFNDAIKDATVRTEMISEQTASFSDDIDLLAYIHNRPHNFSLSNVAAIAEYEKQWEKARRTVSLEMGFISKKEYSERQCFTPRTRGNWDSKRHAEYKTSTGFGHSVYEVATACWCLGKCNLILPYLIVELGDQLPAPEEPDYQESIRECYDMIATIADYAEKATLEINETDTRREEFLQIQKTAKHMMDMITGKRFEIKPEEDD